jgi:hypothetical protein
MTFSYNSASAISNGTYWYVMILGGSYYPNVSFSLLKTNGTKTYSITTYGTSSGGNDGIQLNGMISATLGTLFDSGELIIDSINTSKINGHIIGAKTIEQTSNLDGYFSANIQ